MTRDEWLACEDPAAMLAHLTEPLSPNMRRLGAAPGLRISERKAWLLYFALERHDLSCAPPTDDPEELESRRLALAKCEAGERFADGLCHFTGVLLARWPAKKVPPDAKLMGAGVHLRESVLATGEWLPGAGESAASLFREVVGDPFARVTVGESYPSGYPEPGLPRGRVYHVRPRWLTPDVLSLAQAAYDERLPDGTLDPLRLAVLSDALEEAGCGGEECWNCEVFGDGKVHVHANERCRLTHARLGRGGWCICDCNPGDCPTCEGDRLLMHPLLRHLRSPGPHVRGCWVLDLVLGKE